MAPAVGTPASASIPTARNASAGSGRPGLRVPRSARNFARQAIVSPGPKSGQPLATESASVPAAGAPSSAVSATMRRVPFVVSSGPWATTASIARGSSESTAAPSAGARGGTSAARPPSRPPRARKTRGPASARPRRAASDVTASSATAAVARQPAAPLAASASPMANATAQEIRRAGRTRRLRNREDSVARAGNHQGHQLGFARVHLLSGHRWRRVHRVIPGARAGRPRRPGAGDRQPLLGAAREPRRHQQGRRAHRGRHPR